MTPRVTDDDRDQITVTLDGREIRGWSYADESERRVKMLAAREFCEGWFQANRRETHRQDAADLVDELRDALRAIVEGYPVRGYDDRYIVVANPDFQEGGESDPNIVIDTATLSQGGPDNG